MMPFSARDPRKVAAIGLVVCGLLISLSLRAGDLPFINPARVDHAAVLSDAGGLRVGDPVQVAGVRVGRIDAIEVESDKVVVAFDVDKGVRLGDETRAAVKVASLLGAKFLELESHGDGRLDERIPLERTTPAYDVVTAFADLTNLEAKLDTDTIAEALDTLATTFRHSPDELKQALSGLSRFSATIASRDDEIKELVDHATATAAVLDDRKGDISTLVSATNLLLAELEKRKAVIHRLLVNTTGLAKELTGLVKDNEATLAPALTHLRSVTDLLLKHQDDLAAVIRNLNGYGQTFNNVIGTGPWFDVVIPRLPNSVAVTK